MAKEYKKLVFEDSTRGRTQMTARINELAKDGWIVKSEEISSQGYSFGNTCCLGCIFLPLALLGKKKNQIQVLMERESRNA